MIICIYVYNVVWWWGDGDDHGRSISNFSISIVVQATVYIRDFKADIACGVSQWNFEMQPIHSDDENV